MRYQGTSNKIDLSELSFEQYVASDLFDQEGSWYTRYGKLNNHVTHIHLEELNDFLVNTIGIDAPEYDNLYHLVDDNRQDQEIFNNQFIVEKILDKYKEDLKHLNFDLTSYL